MTSHYAVFSGRLVLPLGFKFFPQHSSVFIPCYD